MPRIAEEDVPDIECPLCHIPFGSVKAYRAHRVGIHMRITYLSQRMVTGAHVMTRWPRRAARRGHNGVFGENLTEDEVDEIIMEDDIEALGHFIRGLKLATIVRVRQDKQNYVWELLAGNYERYFDTPNATPEMVDGMYTRLFERGMDDDENESEDEGEEDGNHDDQDAAPLENHDQELQALIIDALFYDIYDLEIQNNTLQARRNEDEKRIHDLQIQNVTLQAERNEAENRAATHLRRLDDAHQERDVLKSKIKDLEEAAGRAKRNANAGENGEKKKRQSSSIGSKSAPGTGKATTEVKDGAAGSSI